MATPSVAELMALPPEYMNEVNPTSHLLYNCSIGFMVVNTFIFGLFIISVYLNPRNSGIDVYVLMPLAYLTLLGNTLVGLLLVEIGGVGRHIAYYLLNDPKTVTRYLQLQTGVEIIYTASITFPKLAILTLYLKIFVDRVARAVTWSMGAVLVMFFIAQMGVALFVCRPYEFKWNKNINGTCGDIMAGYRWTSVPSIVTDFFILIIPMPTIYKLHMNKYKKIGIFITFLVGGLGLCTAIVRYLTFYKSGLMTDPTFLAGETMAWTIIESSAYFICACLPRLRPVLRKALEETGLGAKVTSTFSSFFNNQNSFMNNTTFFKKNKGTQPKSLSTGQDSSMTQSTYQKNSEDKMGIVQLDEFRTEASSRADRSDRSESV